MQGATGRSGNFNLVLGERPGERAKMNKKNRELIEQAKEILYSGDEEVIRAFKKTIEGIYSLHLIKEKRAARDGTKSVHSTKSGSFVKR